MDSESNKNFPPRPGSPKGAVAFGFRELLNELLSQTNRSYSLSEILPGICLSILRFSGADMVSLRIDEGEHILRYRALIDSDEVQRIGHKSSHSIASAASTSIDCDPIPDVILGSLLAGGVSSTTQSFTRGRSFWTADAARPILLRSPGQADAENQTVIIGGEFASLAVIPFPISSRARGIIFLGGRKREHFTREDVQLYETAAETLGVALAHQRTQWALQERVKELACLYGIDSVASRPDVSLDQFLNEIVELIPPGWQFPDATTARIILDNRYFVTHNFRESEHKQQAEIYADNHQRGAVEVFYTRAFPTADEGPFLKEERNLINTIAETVGRQVAHYEAQWALRERIKELTCLYGIARVASRPGISQEDFLREIVRLLPQGWQYPEITQARITLDGRSFSTDGYVDGPYRQGADIAINEESRGFVEVVYTERVPLAIEGPFLKEERSLINEIARQIGFIIEHWETENEARGLQEQLRHADRLATVGQLSAGVAHELNEPLAAILGFAQLINETKNLPGQASRDTEKIINAALHAREVIRKLMIFTRQLPVRKVKCDLSRLIRDGLYFLESRCAKEGIKIKYQLEDDLPLITADPSQIHQVLVNLAVNAIQAMPGGGELVLKACRQGENVCMVVEDTGIGMTPEVQKQLFVPFFTTKDIGRGTGLGLAVVHGIITGHGGKVRVTSEPGLGSSFEVCLPIDDRRNPEETS